MALKLRQAPTSKNSSWQFIGRSVAKQLWTSHENHRYIE